MASCGKPQVEVLYILLGKYIAWNFSFGEALCRRRSEGLGWRKVGLKFCLVILQKMGWKLINCGWNIAGVFLHRPDSSGWSSGLEVPISFLGCKFLRCSFLAGITLAVFILGIP